MVPAWGYLLAAVAFVKVSALDDASTSLSRHYPAAQEGISLSHAPHTPEGEFEVDCVFNPAYAWLTGHARSQFMVYVGTV